MKYEIKDVHIEANGYEAVRDNLPFIKVKLSIFPSFNSEVLGQFYIPTSTYKLGYKEFIKAVKARCKHDLKFEIGHHSSCGY